MHRMRPPAAKLAQAVQSTNEIAWDVAPRTGTVSLLSQPATKFVFGELTSHFLRQKSDSGLMLPNRLDREDRKSVV